MEKTMKGLKTPNTVQSLTLELENIGVNKGMVILVHSSLSSIGWVNGGEVAVIQALLNVLSEDGTLVMPAHSAVLSDPAHWEAPPVPKEWWQTIRDTMPAFHKAYTPTFGIGKIPEIFRSFPGVIRSEHPDVSFCAWGKHKEKIVHHHELENGLGEGSPLQQLYDMDAHVLLLGAGYDGNTCFHLAEYKISKKKGIKKGAPLEIDGNSKWQEFVDIETREELFESIGEAFEKNNQVILGKIGKAQTRLFKLREGVDFAQTWLENYDKTSNK
ncbi:aminoglycoside phosphotransferase [Bacillus coahuilensis m2-6]|uniref:aminoglycoside N(3)-acetyltransferase n=1 Tax=Bacillus coahuilensis TaxID=408580 RepID=UPI0007502CD4|nr:AAC(3) family N-acetyltransferase [Bacillus coahuilensis]KUP07702.1 aminoglycoside phosphotransferase [Bacillus coahuilensis m2-6]